MKKFNIRWLLVAYDILILGAIDLALLAFYDESKDLAVSSIVFHFLVLLFSIFVVRFIGNIYKQIWRYGGIECYIRLLIVDGIACLVSCGLEAFLPRLFNVQSITFSQLLAISSLNLLCSLAMRMIYRYAYKCGNDNSVFGKFLNWLLSVFAGIKVKKTTEADDSKIKIAIIGAGRVGVSFAEELLTNKVAAYTPRCFVDASAEKANRETHGIPVILESEATPEQLKRFEVQEVVFAIPNLDEKKKKEMFDRYSQAGLKIKVYDYPVIQNASKKRYLREFDIEELLFRKPIEISDQKTIDYYKNKVVLITGGGGSIGSELCRQLAKMDPKEIIILDIYENGAYDIQQELRIAYGNDLKVSIEICSITDKKAMERVFIKHKPNIVINAAAHKHVPLMESNSIEAVENNIFGTVNIVELCEEFKTERFMMVSTDKAVNPTNVMGATKRMCEIIVRCASENGNVKYSSTRFGNVLGSAGSVIPLFKRQIANGGPVTITDKRIIRYFMTIPEASQLVLQSGAMANNGELFVLDMGQPIKILDLAENMIKMSGIRGIEIVETGLRPGEKLYEELLIKDEELEKTENSLIFIEKDEAISKDELNNSLNLLKKACETGDNEFVKTTLKMVVPTYQTPDEVNLKIEENINVYKHMVSVDA